MIEFKKLLYFVLLLIFFSCSTARNRSVSEYKNPSIKKSIINKTRTANLYKDYKRVVIMDAIYFDWELRKLFVENYADSYYEEKHNFLKQQRTEYNNLYTFFVFVSFQKPRSELQKTNSYWKFFVKDEDKGKYFEAEVKKLKKKDLYSFFLEKNFYYYDNWTDIYLVTAVRSSNNKPKFLKLQLASLQGKAEVVWDDPAFIEQVETLDEK